VSEEKLIVVTGGEDTEWPEAVKRAFLAFHLFADAHGFSVMCAVGLNLEKAKAGEAHLSAFFSPRASSNPHRAEMFTDMARMFHKMAERSKQ
jgi:hypothetical protein